MWRRRNSLASMQATLAILVCLAPVESRKHPVASPMGPTTSLEERGGLSISDNKKSASESMVPFYKTQQRSDAWERRAGNYLSGANVPSNLQILHNSKVEVPLSVEYEDDEKPSELLSQDPKEEHTYSCIRD